MKRIILVLGLVCLLIGTATAQRNKRYGFTATIKVPNTKSEVLYDSTLSWIRANLVNPKFTMRRVDETGKLIAGGGSYTSDGGTTRFDLTFYFKNNVVDMVADNVVYSDLGKKPRKERTKGTPKRKTKIYLSNLANSLENHLLGKPQS